MAKSKLDYTVRDSEETATEFYYLLNAMKNLQVTSDLQ